MVASALRRTVPTMMALLGGSTQAFLVRIVLALFEMFISLILPGTCPYVTSVGATQIPTGGSVTTPETACETVIYSGGGFSNVFPMPSYQSTAVKAYFKQYKPSYSMIPPIPATQTISLIPPQHPPNTTTAKLLVATPTSLPMARTTS